MSKRKNMKEALEAQLKAGTPEASNAPFEQAEQVKEPTKQQADSSAEKPKSRNKRSHIGGYFEFEVHKRFNMLCIKLSAPGRKKTGQMLIEEAVEDLLCKYEELV